MTLFWGTLQGTASPTPPLNGNAKSVVSERCLSTVSEDILPDSLPLTFRPHHADDPRQRAATVDFAGPRQDAEGRCSTQGSEEPVAATQTRGAHPLEQGRGKGAGHPIKAPQAGGALA